MGPAGQEGLDLAQDARVLVARLDGGDRMRHALGDEKLSGGDAAKLAGPEDLELAGAGEAELILIEVPLQFRRIGVWARLPTHCSRGNRVWPAYGADMTNRG